MQGSGLGPAYPLSGDSGVSRVCERPLGFLL